MHRKSTWEGKKTEQENFQTPAPVRLVGSQAAGQVLEGREGTCRRGAASFLRLAPHGKPVSPQR